MFEEEKDENIVEDTSLEQDEETSDSSTEETQNEEATSEKATEKVPFNEHPRFKELINEKNELKDEVKQLRNQVFDAVKPKEAEQDPNAGKSLEEKAFYEDMDVRTKRIVDNAIKKAEEKVQVVYDAYGKIAAERFLDKHPDIKKGSQELKDIVKKAQQIGGNLEDAYKIEMFDSNAQREVEKVKKVKQAKTKEKIAANVETRNLPPQAIKAKDDLSFADTFDKTWKDSDIQTEDFL